MFDDIDMPQLSTSAAQTSCQGCGMVTPWARTSWPGSMARVSETIHLSFSTRFSQLKRRNIIISTTLWLSRGGATSSQVR